MQVLEQLRDAIDDLAERASPTVREYSARIAELAAFTADKTAPVPEAGRRGDRGGERQAGRALPDLGRRHPCLPGGTGGAAGAGGATGTETGGTAGDTGDTGAASQASTTAGSADQPPATGDVTVSEFDAVAPDEGGGGIA